MRAINLQKSKGFSYPLLTLTSKLHFQLWSELSHFLGSQTTQKLSELFVFPDRKKGNPDYFENIGDTKNIEVSENFKYLIRLKHLNFQLPPKRKNVRKKFWKKSAGKSRKKWAQRAPLFAAEGCSPPQELENCF